MTNRIQTLRSSVAGNRPIGRLPGELYVNWPDGQLGVINSANNPQDLIAVRFFSTGASYNVGDHVIQAGALYKALVPVSPGVFNPVQWGLAGGGVTVGDTPPTSPQIGSLWWDSVGGQLYVWYNDGSSSQWVVTNNINTPAAVNPVQAMNDNRIINGDMRIDQRNNGASGTAPGYTCDRWQFGGNVTTKGTWQRGGGPSDASIAATGFAYYLYFISNSAYSPAATDVFEFCQLIEADVVTDFAWGTSNAQPVTLSFWVNSSLSGTFGGSIQNAAYTRAFPFSFSLSTNAWTKIVINIPGDTAGTWVMSGNGRSIQVNFDLGSGSSNKGTAGAWVAGALSGVTGTVNVVSTSGATFYITGVKLEIGNVATPFNRYSLAKCMADCQRYYEGGTALWSGNVTSGGTYYDARHFSITKRGAPTMTISDLNNSGFPAGLATVTAVGVDGLQLQKTGNAAQTAGFFQYGWAASAEL